MFQRIALLGAYVNTKQWSVSKMKAPYDIRLLTLIHVFTKRIRSIISITKMLYQS
jgi:hypothetical protein